MSKDAEELRVEAEKERVLAEEGRVHAESNEGTGRVEAEEERKMNEIARKAAAGEFDKWRQRATLGYLVLALGCIAGIFAVSENSKSDLKNQINEFAKASCLASISPKSTLNKYNDLINVQIEANKSARKINLSQGDRARAKLNTKTINRLKNNKAEIPTPQKCEIPILK